MKDAVIVIDRGIDEVLVIEGNRFCINELKGKQLIELLNREGITNIKMVSFDEYEEFKLKDFF